MISDWMGASDFKWRNIAKRRLFDIIPPEATGAFLDANQAKIGGVFHMGAISTTTETDIDAIVRNNIRLSIDLWTRCSQAKIPLVYASSAATYGDGREGFLDRFDADYLSRLRPLNAYGWSKALFDRWVQHAVATGAPCCEFRFNPAGDSDLMSAAVPISCRPPFRNEAGHLSRSRL